MNFAPSLGIFRYGYYFAPKNTALTGAQTWRRFVNAYIDADIENNVEFSPVRHPEEATVATNLNVYTELGRCDSPTISDLLKDLK